MARCQSSSEALRRFNTYFFECMWTPKIPNYGLNSLNFESMLLMSKIITGTTETRNRTNQLQKWMIIPREKKQLLKGTTGSTKFRSANWPFPCICSTPKYRWQRLKSHMCKFYWAKASTTASIIINTFTMVCDHHVCHCRKPSLVQSSAINQWAHLFYPSA